MKRTVALLALTACGGIVEPSPVEPTPSTSTPTPAPPVKGGDATKRPNEATDAQPPDTCGGSKPLSCPEGMFCALGDGAVDPTKYYGWCRPYAKVGDPCGDASRSDDAWCAPGLLCYQPVASEVGTCAANIHVQPWNVAVSWSESAGVVVDYELWEWPGIKSRVVASLNRATNRLVLEFWVEAPVFPGAGDATKSFHEELGMADLQPGKTYGVDLLDMHPEAEPRIFWQTILTTAP